MRIFFSWGGFDDALIRLAKGDPRRNLLAGPDEFYCQARNQEIWRKRRSSPGGVTAGKRKMKP